MSNNAKILYDTGFIVASLVRSDNYHQRTVELLKHNSGQLVTTWPCLTEAIYLTANTGGVNAQEGLLRQIETGFLNLIGQTVADALRCCVLMRQYADTPMDFADASLVVAAERLDIVRIFTFDSHFHAYRISGKAAFQVIQ